MSRIGGLITGVWRLVAIVGGFVGIRWLGNLIARRLDTPIVRAALSEIWERTRGSVHWYAASTVIHMLLFTAALLILGNMHFQSAEKTIGFAPVDDDLSVKPSLEQMGEFVDPMDTSELNTADLRNPQFKAQTGQSNDASANFTEAGGGRENVVGADGSGFGGFDFAAPGLGPSVHGQGGIGAGRGYGDQDGSGGASSGFGGRGTGRRREMLGKYGGTKNTEMAVIAALNWFARHRNTNGSWSLSRFSAHCTGNPCTGAGSADSDVAATSLSLLTFLAAGQTHKSNGPYQPVVNQGLFWLIKHQARSGDLSGGSPMAQMYAHALATITLCEAYGLTKDQKVGDAAALAVLYIEAAQNQSTGGWRYVPQDPTGGDTSVLGWQIMALHSAQLAGVPVSRQTLEGAKQWLGSVCKGNYRGLYAYQDFKEPTPTMTAIGMLSWQYLGMRPDDPAMAEGKQYLLQNLPDNGRRDTYYWYYATQVMHNLLGSDWDAWNRQMRKTLIETQCHQGCSAGSWDPENPTLDTWGAQGGRIVTTAFSTLTLEIYYRYLPLYQSGGSASDRSPPAVTSTPSPEAVGAVGAPF